LSLGAGINGCRHVQEDRVELRRASFHASHFLVLDPTVKYHRRILTLARKSERNGSDERTLLSLFLEAQHFTAFVNAQTKTTLDRIRHVTCGREFDMVRQSNRTLICLFTQIKRALTAQIMVSCYLSYNFFFRIHNISN